MSYQNLEIGSLEELQDRSRASSQGPASDKMGAQPGNDLDYRTINLNDDDDKTNSNKKMTNLELAKQIRNMIKVIEKQDDMIDQQNRRIEIMHRKTAAIEDKKEEKSTKDLATKLLWKYMPQELPGGKFTGKTGVGKFISDCERVFREYEITDDKSKIILSRRFMDDQLADSFSKIAGISHGRDSYELYKTKLRSVFQDKGISQFQMERCKQDSTETFQIFMIRFMTSLSDDPREADKTDNPFAEWRRSFFYNLRTEYQEAFTAFARQEYGATSVWTPPHQLTMERMKCLAEVTELNKADRKIRLIENSVMKIDDNQDRPGGCWFCGKIGHRHLGCPTSALYEDDDKIELLNGGYRLASGLMIWLKAGEVVQKQIDEYFGKGGKRITIDDQIKILEDRINRLKIKGANKKSYNYMIKIDGNSPEIRIQIENDNQEWIEAYTLIDSGAQVSIINEDFAKRLNLPIYENVCIRAEAFGGSKVDLDGFVTTRVICDGRITNVRCFLMPDLSMDLLLGLDWGNDWGGIIKFGTKSGSLTQIRTLYKPVNRRCVPNDVIHASLAGDPKIRWKKPSGYLNEERIKTLKIGEQLNDKEKEYLIKQLKSVEEVIAFTDNEKGLANPEWIPPVKIVTVNHTPWRERAMRIPESMKEQVCDLLKAKISSGVLEYSKSPYCNRWFMIPKKNKSLRFIQDVQPLNKVSIRNAHAPPIADEIIEQNSGARILSAIDLYSGYDQIQLHPMSRPYTAMKTPLGLVQMKVLPMGYTNSVAEFQRAVEAVLAEFIPRVATNYLEDIIINTEAFFDKKDDLIDKEGIRPFVRIHIDTTVKILKTLREAGLAISGEKSVFASNKVSVLGFELSREGRNPTEDKLAKLSDWPVPKSVKEIRSFLGFTGYNRIFIKDYAMISKPLVELTKKGSFFIWGDKEMAAFKEIKDRLTSAPCLGKIDYTDIIARPPIITTDASLEGVGAVLSQIKEDGLRHPIRYMSKKFTEVEQNYPAVKREALAILFAIKSFKYWIFGVKFVLESDAKALIYIRSNGAVQECDAILHRWLARISAYDFDFRYVKGSENGEADALSRDPRFQRIDAKICTIGYQYPSLQEIKDAIRDKKIPESWKRLIRNYRLSDTTLQFLDVNGWRNVIEDLDFRKTLISRTHIGLGHRGAYAIEMQIRRRYWWPKIREQIRSFVKSCEICQRFSQKPPMTSIGFTVASGVWEKLAIDVIHMPLSHRKGYIFHLVDTFTKWSEAYPLINASGKEVVRCLGDIFARFGDPRLLVSDRGEVGSKEVQLFCQNRSIKLIRTSPYHPQGNGIVERAHQTLVNQLAKIADEKKLAWDKVLYDALKADRIAINRSTGFSPFELMFGRDPFIDQNDNDLQPSIAVRDAQIQTLKDTRKLAALTLTKSREDNAIRYGRSDRRLEISPGDLVLVDNKVQSSYENRKMEPRFKGPFIVDEIRDNRTAKLRDITGTLLETQEHLNRLKRFYIPGEEVHE
jgi:hypothetical protein